jgi:anti-sigma B factor antagonist
VALCDARGARHDGAMDSSASTPNFKLWTESEETAHIVHVEGELDLHTRVELEGVLDGLSRPPMIVVLEISALAFVDSTGLRALLNEHRRARAEGYEFVIAGANGAVREVLRITALDITLPLVSDVDAITRP